MWRTSNFSEMKFVCLVVQARDWVLHRRECKGISRVPPDVTPTDTMRLLIRSLQGDNTKNRTQVCLPHVLVCLVCTIYYLSM